MKYDDLEKTKDLFDIPDGEVPSPIEDLDREGMSKETITDDLTFGLLGEDAIEGQKEQIEFLEKENKPKSELKKNKKLSKKSKIIIIVSIILLILIIIAVVLFLILRKEEKEPPKEPEEPSVIIERDNYIYQNGTLIFLNEAGDEIGTYTCTNQEEELCFIASYSNEDEFDKERQVYEDESNVLVRTKIYQDNYVFIFDHESIEDEGLVLYNISEQEIEETYNLVKGFTDSDFVILKDSNGRYGALEFTNSGSKEVFEFSYDYLGRLNSDANIVVNTNNRYYIYNVKQKNLSQGLRYDIMSYNDEYIVVDNNGYYVYDYDGNLIFDEAYDFIELLDDYAVLIDRDLLYIRDYQNNKYNEVGVKLATDYYNPVYVYREDHSLVETRRAYEITINDDMLDVTYTEDDKQRSKTIDLQDGKMSKEYKYIDYFDGILYFYSDEEETELLGSYECSNANSSDLTNCTIATESFYSQNELEEDQSKNLGWIPIYNNRFVFIMDTIDLNNPTIVLYDLKENKSLTKYSTVDSGAYTKKRAVSFVNADATYVMAQAKNDDEYGLLRITDSNVSGAIKFDYTSIEKFGDYYLVSTAGNTYMLYANTGGTDPITKAYGYEIVNYADQVVLVKDKDSYYVYDFDGNRLREDDGAYEYVDLQKNYYVVIQNNHLNIHKYDDPLYALSEIIDVGTDKYDNAYTIKENNGGFTVTITHTNMTYTFDDLGNDVNAEPPVEEPLPEEESPVSEETLPKIE